MSMTILTGNIGSGKSLLASKFAKMGQVVVNMDNLQRMFSGGEYGAYDPAKKEVYQQTETVAIESSLDSGLDVVIDRTNMTVNSRARFIKIGVKHARWIRSFDFGAGTKEALERRKSNSHGIPNHVWNDVFRKMDSVYEPPLFEEGFDSIIKGPTRYKFHTFDFDGTIVENKFPSIGEIIDGTVEKMNEIWKNLSNIIIIWTCRSGNYENEMRAFLLKQKIPFDFINENPMVNFGSPKIFAHEYYDDRGCEFPIRK